MKEADSPYKHTKFFKKLASIIDKKYNVFKNWASIDNILAVFLAVSGIPIPKSTIISFHDPNITISTLERNGIINYNESKHLLQFPAIYAYIISNHLKSTGK